MGDQIAPGRGMERVGAALLGAASGGVLGVLVAGLLGMVRGGGSPPIALTAGLAVFLAVGMAAMNLHQKQPEQPVSPRAVWCVALTAVALLITLGVFLLQSAYVQGATKAGRPVHYPLEVWPISRVALWTSLAAVLLGVVSSLWSLLELAARRGAPGSGKWVAMAVLAGGAWVGLALICYIMGYGFTFVA
ncbi:MAG: hypothetical protein HY238_04835 [Acidobacteria bacterium]|nr:hypothetical protein [Acidobacteriota bacterium]